MKRIWIGPKTAAQLQWVLGLFTGLNLWAVGACVRSELFLTGLILCGLSFLLLWVSKCLIPDAEGWVLVWNWREWRYYWRRYLTWMPVQFCLACDKPYWGGLPRWWWVNGKFQCTWQAGWSDACSQKCADELLDIPF